MRNLLATLFILFFAGCSFAGTGEKPEVSIVDVQFGDMSVFETTANFTIRVQNENPFALKFEGAAHNIYLNGINIGKGLVSEPFEVPRLGTSTHNVKIHLSNLTLIRNLQELMDAKAFQYRVDSTLYRPGVLGLSNVKVSESGQFNRF